MSKQQSSSYMLFSNFKEPQLELLAGHLEHLIIINWKQWISHIKICEIEGEKRGEYGRQGGEEKRSPCRGRCRCGTRQGQRRGWSRRHSNLGAAADGERSGEYRRRRRRWTHMAALCFDMLWSGRDAGLPKDGGLWAIAGGGFPPFLDLGYGLWNMQMITMVKRIIYY